MASDGLARSTSARRCQCQREMVKTHERAILESAQERLDKDMLVCCPVAVDQENGDVQEERFMMPGEEINTNWSDNEIPTEQRDDLLRKVPKATRQEVRRTHNGLGHP